MKKRMIAKNAQKKIIKRLNMKKIMRGYTLKKHNLILPKKIIEIKMKFKKNQINLMTKMHFQGQRHYKIIHVKRSKVMQVLKDQVLTRT